MSKHNLREVNIDSCSNCKHLMEDLGATSMMIHHSCPLHGTHDMLETPQICDEFKKTTELPEKTERRKNNRDFFEQMEYNTSKFKDIGSVELLELTGEYKEI